MNKMEAKKLAGKELFEYKKLSYSEILLKLKVGEPETFEKVNNWGEEYRVEVEFLFDDEEEGNIRVMTAISYSFWTDLSPVSDDFIIAPDGKFIGE